MTRFCVGVLFLLFSINTFAAAKLVYMREAEGQKHIFISSEAGYEPRQLTSGALWHLYPDIDSTGRYVAYVEGADERSLQLMMLDRHTGRLEQWTTIKGLVIHPDFSGDGRYLAFSGPLGEKGVSRIGIIDLEKARKEVVPVLNEKAQPARWVYDVAPKVIASAYPSYFPALTSDGSGLIFQESISKSERRVVEYDFENEKAIVLSDPKVSSMSPSLSFDDRFVAFTSKVEENWDVYVFDRISKETRRMTRDPAQDFAPSFSADGSVLFASDRSGHFNLYQSEKPFEERLLVADTEADLYAPSISGSTRLTQNLLTPIPDPARSSFGTVRVGNRVYVAGGHQGHEHTYPAESFLDSLQYFDLTTKQWHTAAPQPEPCHGFGIIDSGKFIYAFGGFAFSDKHKPKWKSLDRIDRYDTETNTWKGVGTLPHPRSSNVVAKLGTKVYLMSGWDSTPKFADDAAGVFHDSIDVFDLETEKVETIDVKVPPPLRRALTSVVVGDEILLLGGLGQGASHFELLDNVTAFQPATGRWRELPKLPFKTFAPAAGMMGGKVFLFGGMFKTGPFAYNYVNHIFALGLKQGEWHHTGRYLTETKGFAMVVPLSATTLGVLGGHSYFADTDAPVPTFETISLTR